MTVKVLQICGFKRMGDMMKEANGVIGKLMQVDHVVYMRLAEKVEKVC